MANFDMFRQAGHFIKHKPLTAEESAALLHSA